MDSKFARNVLVGCAVAIVAGGCAGNSQRRADRGDDETYRDDFVRAEASIEGAQRLGAFESGGAELTRAREKLDAARRASEEGEAEVAQRLAIEANLDADLAVATARNQEAQSAVSELQQSIEALQDELRRSEQRSPGRL
jgi:hypothetical protein